MQNLHSKYPGESHRQKIYSLLNIIANMNYYCFRTFFDRLIFDFENLYNGDKLLGESTNQFLNESWDDIFREIKTNIFDAFTLIAENTLRNTFNKVPYNDLFAN